LVSDIPAGDGKSLTFFYRVQKIRQGILVPYLFCCETEALGEDALDDADDDEDDEDDGDVEEDEMDMWLYLRLTDELSHNAIECRR
jgi:hypothetical protein